MSVPSRPLRDPSETHFVRIKVSLPRDLDEWLQSIADSRSVAKATLIRMLLLTCRERDYLND